MIARGLKDTLIVLGCGSHKETPLRTGESESQADLVSVWNLEDSPHGYPVSLERTGFLSISQLGELYGAANQQLSRDVATGRRPPADLNGHFLLFAWDEANRVLRVWTDRFGTIHAYYASNGKRTAIGTSFRSVASVASCRELDWEALAGFFGFGFFPADRTFYRDVCILMPASVYTFDAEGRLLSHERYWTWNYAPDYTRSYDATVAEFADLFRIVMQDLLREGRIALPISGGLDSRSTIAVVNKELVDSGRLWAYSYGYGTESVETSIAQQVAQARSIPFSRFAIQPYLFDRIDLVMDCIEGFQDITQCRQAAVAEAIASHSDYVIAAHWGDVWLDDMGLADFEQTPMTHERIEEFALRKMLKRGREWLLQKLCTPHVPRVELTDLLRSFVRDELEDLSHISDPDFRVKALKTMTWCFRWTCASLRMFHPGAFPRLPFYDTRMTDFFSTVPTHFLKGRRLQIDYLKRSAPDLARIKWQPYDANLYAYHRFGTWHIPKRALKKAWRILTRKPVIQRNWEVQFLNEQGRQGLTHWLLRSGLRLHDLVPRRDVQELVERLYRNPHDPGLGYAVSMLLTFSVWLERYG